MGFLHFCGEDRDVCKQEGRFNVISYFVTMALSSLLVFHILGTRLHFSYLPLSCMEAVVVVGEEHYECENLFFPI